MPLSDITHLGGPNAGGLLKFYAALKEDVEEIPDPTTGSYNVATDITCKTGKKFAEFYFTVDTGKLSINAAGENDGKSKESLAEFFIPKLTPEKEFELDKLLNAQAILLVEDGNDNLRIIGDLKRGAILEKMDGSTGAAMTERNGIALSLKYNSKLSPLYYAGAVPLTPAA